MRYSDIPAAQLAVQVAREMGISKVVISPGSRNAPLIISFTSDAHFTCYSLVDERSAGFFALGMAKQLQEAVVLVCTSGSALLNYYPAIAEAYYSCIPLIVLSADRPPYKIDIGDGQTIRQRGVLQKHCDLNVQTELDIIHAPEEQFRARGQALPEEERLLRAQAKIQRNNLSTICEAYAYALQNRMPAHINMPFEEPLYGRIELNTRPVVPRQAQTNPGAENVQVSAYHKKWQQASRKMILIGAAAPDSISETLLEKWSKDPSILVFTETTANMHHPSFFSSIDSIIAPLEKINDNNLLFRKLQSDILLTIGGMVISKKVKAFLRRYPPDEHWHLGHEPGRATFFIQPKSIPLTPDAFFKDGKGKIKDDQIGYRTVWDHVKSQYLKLRKEYLQGIPFSDFKVFESIIARIPAGSVVHFANSSAIRYAQLFDLHPSLAVYANRGTSGIEGSTSTAIGAAVVSERPTVLITGDLGFLYDSNAFWHDYLPAHFRVIVINNSGGGIFRILPGKEETDVFERYFETVHARDCRAICDAYGLTYYKALYGADLDAVWDSFYSEDDGVKLLEIFTPRKENDRILLDYFDFLSSETSYNHILIASTDGEQER